MKMDIEQFLNHLSDSSKALLQETDSLQPIMMFGRFDEKNEAGFEISFLDFPPELVNSNHTKDLLSEIVHEAAKQIHPDFFVFITDAWVAAMPEEEYKTKKEKFKSVSEMPGRQEGILIHFETKEKQYLWTQIYKKENGTYKFEQHKSESKDAVGRFTKVVFQDFEERQRRYN